MLVSEAMRGPTNPTPETALPETSGLPAVDQASLKAMYRQLLLLRRIEELAAKGYTQGKILGFCHLYIGQEAIAVGCAAATRAADYWIAAYRDHAHAIAKGMTPRSMMAELFGKATGCSGGYGGSMHMFDAEARFLGGYGIVGGQVPLANGIGWALKQGETDDVCLCFFGDGAANQGVFFEALCLAQLYKLPVVFICENNYYAMGTPLDRQSAVTDMSVRGLGVGMTRDRFEGFDAEVVRERVGRAVQHARAGHGPVFLEILTYRYRGHSMSDPAKYRPEGELEEKKLSDPLLITEKRLRADFGFTDDHVEALKAEVEAECKDAWDFASESEIPDPKDLYKNVYAD
jgi:pyruvate dehydrogenase E1 component alpha subunit